MKKAIVLKWSLRAAVLAAGGWLVYYSKLKKENVDRLETELQRATDALESQNKVMRELQKQLGIEVEEGSD